ncbi:MAG: hypothetical protein IK078_04020 [Lachnospiraceae bacterium]|nr:hypothetical protein [Lachnospiraceae bacterium]
MKTSEHIPDHGHDDEEDGRAIAEKYELTRRMMRSKMRRGISVMISVIALIAVIAFASVFIKQGSKFAYSEHLDDEVLSLDDTVVSLREFGFYIYEVESFTQQQARKYNHTDPLDYWNTHFSAGVDSQFISEMARDAALNACLGDLVYAHMAQDAGFVLPDEEKAGIADAVTKWMQEISKEQLEVLGLDETLVRKMVERQTLAKAYAYEYSREADLSGYSGNAAELLSGGGDYFEKELLTKYPMKKNEKLIEQLKFGRISVNVGE